MTYPDATSPGGTGVLSPAGPAAAHATLLRKRIWELARVDLDNYKPRQMNRRLSALLSRSGFSDWAEYLDHLEADRQDLQAFKSYLTINVTRFFRDPHRWDQLAATVLPQLLTERRRLRMWSAGCSQGAEPYTLAVLLDELGQADAGHTVLATDIDDAKLTVARAGGPYTADDLEHVVGERRRRHFERRPDGWWVGRAALPAVTFRHHDLLGDAFGRGYDLIVCRNVVIYFADEVKRTLYVRFAEALRPGGVLFVGGTETVPSMPGVPLCPAGISFYRKEPG